VGELIGYARCSTVLQDLTAQRDILAGLGVPEDRIYLDKGLTGTTRARPGLDQALAAVRSGDTLVVPKLDRLARSVLDARQIGDSLVAGGIRLFPRGVAGPSPRRYRAARLTRTRARLTRLAARRLSRSPAGSSASSARNSSTNMGCIVFSTGITGRGAAAGRAGHAWPAAAAPAREAPARTATPRWRFRWWPADRGQQRFPGTRQFPFPGGLTLSARHLRASR
jgi:Resolvase, N terminal domain